MPNRSIKESICTSDTLAKISPSAERLFWRLVVQADDFGLYDARPNIILGKCLTSMMDRVRPSDISEWLDELESVGLLFRYSVDGKPYLKLTTWDMYQRRRANSPKFPLPPADEGNGKHLLSNDNKCGQVPTDDGFARARPNDPDPDPDVEVEVGTGAEQHSGSPTPSSADVTQGEREVLQTLRSIERYPFDFAKDLEYIQTLSVDFPAVDLLEEAKKYATWVLDHPLKAKSNPRLQFRNWLTKAVQWQKNTTPRTSPRDPPGRVPDIEEIWKQAGVDP